MSIEPQQHQTMNAISLYSSSAQQGLPVLPSTIRNYPLVTMSSRSNLASASRCFIKCLVVASVATIIGGECGESAAASFVDDFTGTTLDTNKWTPLTYLDGSITQGGGFLTFNHPNRGGAFVTSKPGFEAPFTVTGSFIGQRVGIFGIVTRASGAYNQSNYYDPYGLSFSFFDAYPNNIPHPIFLIQYAEPGKLTNLFSKEISFDPTVMNFFSITDHGDSVSVTLNGQVLADIAVDPGLGVGNKIIIADGDRWDSSGPSYSRFGAITVMSDKDGDGIPDIHETNTGVYVSLTDTGTDPDNQDTDADGIPDGKEVYDYSTNPHKSDSDGDGFNDLAEIQAGKLPADPLNKPDAQAEIHPAVEFVFYSENGVDYRVEWSVNLTDWQPMPEVIHGDGNPVSRLYITRDQPRRFYRASRLSGP